MFTISFTGFLLFYFCLKVLRSRRQASGQTPHTAVSGGLVPDLLSIWAAARWGHRTQWGAGVLFPGLDIMNSL